MEQYLKIYLCSYMLNTDTFFNSFQNFSLEKKKHLKKVPENNTMVNIPIGHTELQ